MAPLYFFYNLPHSESKDVLQSIMDPEGSRSSEDENQNATTIGDAESDCAGATHSDRCAIQ